MMERWKRQVLQLPLVRQVAMRHNAWRSQWRALRDPARRDEAQPLRIHPVFVARDREGFLEAVDRVQWTEARPIDADLSRPGKDGTFVLRRFCLCCNATTSMRVDFESSYRREDGRPVPNWRETLVCGRCGMNNRQRLVAKLVEQAAAQRPRASIYLMEQVTPIFAWVRRIAGADVHGSEYLGYQYQGGQKVRGIRHEDVMKLSYPDASFDLIVSNDVLEHIPDPARALSECFRALKPGGAVLATFPFHVKQAATTVRARVVGDRLEHLLPPEYHGNPLSSDGSLVFHDFGWDLLETMRDAGFMQPECEVYASDRFGHLGDGLLVFRLVRPNGA